MRLLAIDFPNKDFPSIPFENTSMSAHLAKIDGIIISLGDQETNKIPFISHLKNSNQFQDILIIAVIDPAHFSLHKKLLTMGVDLIHFKDQEIKNTIINLKQITLKKEQYSIKLLSNQKTNIYSLNRIKNLSDQFINILSGRNGEIQPQELIFSCPQLKELRISKMLPTNNGFYGELNSLENVISLRKENNSGLNKVGIQGFIKENKQYNLYNKSILILDRRLALIKEDIPYLLNINASPKDMLLGISNNKPDIIIYEALDNSSSLLISNILWKITSTIESQDGYNPKIYVTNIKSPIKHHYKNVEVFKQKTSIELILSKIIENSTPNHIQFKPDSITSHVYIKEEVELLAHTHNSVKIRTDADYRENSLFYHPQYGKKFLKIYKKRKVLNKFVYDAIVTSINKIEARKWKKYSNHIQ